MELFHFYKYSYADISIKTLSIHCYGSCVEIIIQNNSFGIVKGLERSMCVHVAIGNLIEKDSIDLVKQN